MSFTIERDKRHSGNKKWSIKGDGKVKRIDLPKLGSVRFWSQGAIDAFVLQAHVIKEPDDWYIALVYDIAPEREQNNEAIIGLDWGVAHFMTTHEGETFDVPDSWAKNEAAILRYQQAIPRKVKGSINHKKAKNDLAKSQRKFKRSKDWWLHTTTSYLANNYHIVIVEDITGGMVKNPTGSIEVPGTNVKYKKNLNRLIRRVGFYRFCQFLEYKLEERGGALIKVNPAYTSQDCNGCGNRDANNRKSQSSFKCTSCGLEMNADQNAAINILQRGLKKLDIKKIA